MSVRFPGSATRSRRLLALAGAISALPAPLWAAPETPREIWFGMYLGEMKVGHMSVGEQKIEYRGRPAVRTESVAHTEMVLLGSQMSQDIASVVFSGLEGRPISEEFRLSSGGKTTTVTAEFKQSVIECRMVTSAGATEKQVPIPAGAVLVGESYLPALREKPVIGASYERMTFNPLTLALDPLKVSVLREETIQHGGASVRAVVVQAASPLGDMTAYQSPDGVDIYKIEAPMGLVMVRETKEVATATPSAGYLPPQDFAVVTSVRPDVPLPADSPLQSLRIRLSGIPDASFVIADERQKVVSQTAGPPRAVVYQISPRKPDPASSSSLPVKNAALKAWLQPDAYIDSGNPAIVRRARQIVGAEKNIVKAAEKLRRTVQSTVKTDGSMGILRPASDVLASPTGVCRDHAILLAALARAAGIPARPVGGLVLSRGSFFYHAWAEVWTGKGWLALDSTLPPPVVDAGHIKLTQGDVTRMYQISRVVGQLKAEILSFR